jgi:hypothetical protein
MDKNMYLKRKETEYGPFDREQVQTLLDNGKIKPNDQMRSRGERHWQPASSFLKTLGFAVAIGAGGLLLASVLADQPADELIAQWDIDGDGIADIALFDTNGDGTGDVLAFDTDGDGWADMQIHDVDHDGIADVVAWDTNGDGILDSFSEIEVDGDAVAEAVGEFFSSIFG